jgi:DNA mismatch repair protein MutL
METRPSRIRLLPPELAEQIAAGEVVERPGSVVKELVENALDAGARKIEVTLEAGGRRLIRVVDDGCGMTEEEARLSLRRHATSKVTCADDLWRLTTFGFRGEALPSIASVAKLTLATKVPGALAGFRVTLEGGREIDAREHGMPDGTQIEVRELFYNVPARLKFLKTEATEAGNVADSLLRLALANPAVHVKLRSNDRTVLDLPPVDGFGERVRSALGRRGAGALHEAAGEENGVRVHAFVAGPEEASTTPRNTFLFVGGRAIRDRALVGALAMAYGELLDKGRYPLCALFLDVPGADLDVNVHPQKLEVRFAHAQEVYAAVRHVVGAAITRAPWLAPERQPFSRPFQAAPGDANGAPGLGTEATAPWSLEAAARAAALGGAAGDQFESPGGARDSGAGRPRYAGFTYSARPGAADGQLAGAGWGGDVVPPGPGQAFLPTLSTAFFEGLRYLGQLHRSYLVCEAPGELVLVDQHAAHERLAFQRLRKAHGDRAIARQRLLFPLEVEVDDVALALALDAQVAEQLGELGFEVEPATGPAAAGPGQRLIVRAVPELLKDAAVKPLLLDALAGLGEIDEAGPEVGRAEAALHHLLATLACHSVRRAGDVMDREQAVALLAALDEVDFRSHCPHGRPVVVRLTVTELERRFGRT